MSAMSWIIASDYIFSVDQPIRKDFNTKTSFCLKFFMPIWRYGLILLYIMSLFLHQASNLLLLWHSGNGLLLTTMPLYKDNARRFHMPCNFYLPMSCVIISNERDLELHPLKKWCVQNTHTCDSLHFIDISINDTS